MDLTDTITPKSDQLNAEDLLTGPRTFTITEVRVVGGDQPVSIHLAENPGRPFKPSKTVRRILVAAWGKEGDDYVGRRFTLYREPKVKWAGEEIGGIRIQAMSHIDKPLKLALAVSSSKRESFMVQPLKAEAPAAPAPDYVADAQAAKSLDEWRKVWKRAHDAGHLSDALKAKLTPLGEALKPQTDAEPTLPGADQ